MVAIRNRSHLKKESLMSIEAIISLVTGIISIATVITALTPSKADDKILAGFLKFINLLAGNVGKNKNADA